MKLVKEHINFERGLDPKKAMGIGLRFKTLEEFGRFAFDNLKEITGSDKLVFTKRDPDLVYMIQYKKIVKWFKQNINLVNSEVLAKFNTDKNFIDFWQGFIGRYMELNESRFERGLDPQKAMGIGLYVKRNFNTWEEITSFIYQHICEIAEIKDAKDVLSKDRSYYFKSLPYQKIDDYIQQYVRYNTSKIDFSVIDSDVYNLIKKDANPIQTKRIGIEEAQHFERGLNPKEAMNIGLFSIHTFQHETDAAEYMFEFLAGILGVKEIPKDIIGPKQLWFTSNYYELIQKYIDKYIKILEPQTKVDNAWEITYQLHELLHKAGYEKGIVNEFNESHFERGLNPKRAMRVGKYKPNPENPFDTVIVRADFNEKPKVFKIIEILKKEYQNVSLLKAVYTNQRYRAIAVEDPSATIEDVADLLWQYTANGTIHTINYLFK